MREGEGEGEGEEGEREGGEKDERAYFFQTFRNLDASLQVFKRKGRINGIYPRQRVSPYATTVVRRYLC